MTMRETSAHVVDVSIFSLSSQSMDTEDNTQQAGPKAKSRVHYTEREYKISEQQAIHDPGRGRTQRRRTLMWEKPRISTKA